MIRAEGSTELDRVVCLFIEIVVREQMDTPDGADGMCVYLSKYFSEFCETFGIDTECIPVLHEIRQDWHCIVKVGDDFVDWSYRQYEPDAPMPLIFPENRLGELGWRVDDETLHTWRITGRVL